MRRIVCREFGPPENLEIEEVPNLEPGPGQVVVDVKAAGVNFVDALFVQGKYQIKPQTPFTPGGEVAGVVNAAGAGVKEFAAGDRVCASTWLGGYAGQVAIAASSAFALSGGISFGQGATFAQSYATAVFALTQRINVSAQDWVLVLGSGGGVGRACVDVARSLGARVIGAASSEEKRRAARDAGAEATIDTTTEDVKVRARETTGGGVDVVCDPVGGALAEPALRALRVGGRYLVLGFAAGEIPRLPLNQILLSNRTVVGVDWGAWTMQHQDENRELIERILSDVAAGKLSPIEPTQVPLGRAAEVLRDIENRRVTGKVVLVP
jgi:NADPH2:quinone reductase